MKKLYLTLIAMVFGLLTQAQSISVKSFQALPMDMTASSLEGKRIDQNGATAALIKIVTSQTGFAFDGGALGIVDSKQMVGEVWVWVPYGSRKITISHQQLGVLRDYRYPIEIQSERTYEMVLTTAKIETIVKEEVREQYLVFQITPPDAMLEVDDQMWSVSPEGTARKLVDFGTYSYRVQALNYHPDAGRVTVDDPDNTQKVTVTLKPNFGWIEVPGGSALQGAAVYIDNTLIGKAPCKSEALKSGQHSVRILKDLYEPYIVTVIVNDEETTQLSPELTANFACVTLQVDADAEIWVNDEKKGIRTWTGNLESGTYKMECRMAGHESTTTRKEISNKTSDEVIQLEAPRPIYGSLNVESTPDFTKIFIDGKLIGETPKLIKEILIGQHELKLTKDGYADHTETITIKKGERKQVNATLSDKPKGIETFTVNGVSFTMKLVEGGTFTMGWYDFDATPDEKRVHSVSVSTFMMGETEVTQALWKAVMGTTIADQCAKTNMSWTLKGEGDDYPMYYVSWNDCQDFLTNLNRLTGKSFRLPTEAEWEYAARGGAKSNGYKYAGSNTIGNVAWYMDNVSGRTHIVKTMSPNEIGLYDMSGNVYEWCQDWFDTYDGNYQIDPVGPSDGSQRVLRGGSWIDNASYCRVSYRICDIPSIRNARCGFRLCLPQ